MSAGRPRRRLVALEASSKPVPVQDATPPEREVMVSAQVADLLQVSTSTLCRWRRDGLGPPFILLAPNAPRYLRSLVMAWLKELAA